MPNPLKKLSIKMEGVRFDSQQREKFIKKRNKWFMLAFISTGIPYLLPFLIASFCDSTNYLKLIANGEILLSLFGLTIPMAFDIYDAKETKDYNMDIALAWCIVTSVFSIVIYTLIRFSSEISKDESHTTKILIYSIVLSVLSLYCCIRSIAALENHIEIAASNKGKEK